MRIEQLRREFDLKLRWSVFPLHPETPEEGRELADLFAGVDVDLDAMAARLQMVATELELPLSRRGRTYNSRRAQQLGKWAEELGRAEAFHGAAYRAYFAEGRNISRPAELIEIARMAGLTGEDVSKALEERRYRDAVDADWDRARRLGVTAVPTLIYGERRLVGFQPYPAFRRLIAG